uniref:sugar phosphate isomerase/epimerase family protein n=1 Tax=Tessaracoccus timonensis TaxID=2161816 RepID=UPI000D55FA0B|nr:sugar phosphate isomerase/epimerase [Tessaracoccus timonensis]
MSLVLGAYTACLHDRPLADALDTLKGMGLTGAELNIGGFIPSPHAHVDALLASQAARDELLALFEEKGMVLAGLTASGNPLNPLPDIGPRHHYDLKRGIELAGKLGVEEIVCMSGAPGSDPDAKYPSWVVNPWDGVYGEILDYQHSVLDPYWREMDQRAQDNNVKLAIELHPHNTIFTPVGFMEFAERIDAKNVGVNMDPSHLMWQQVDAIEATRYLGERIFHVHAKDTKIEPGVGIRGVLDTSHKRPPANEAERYPSGMNHWCQVWPDDPAWRFVHVGAGHDQAWWTEFLRAVAEINPEMHVNIEHEDNHFDNVTGLERGAEMLIAANAAL